MDVAINYITTSIYVFLLYLKTIFQDLICLMANYITLRQFKAINSKEQLLKHK